MERAISETKRRRKKQKAYNDAHGITPAGITKAIDGGLRDLIPKEEKPGINLNKIPKTEYEHLIKDLTAQMDMASANLQFEHAAELRDQIAEIKKAL